MSTRVDQRSKNQPSNHQQSQQQGTSSANPRRDDYDYSNHLQLQSQPSVSQQVQYNPSVISNQTSENSYFPPYYHTNMNSMNYPASFLEASTWTTTSNSDASMSYLNSFVPDYSQFSSGFEYPQSVGFSWPSYGGTSDYSSWNSQQQVDPMKVDSQHLNLVGQTYGDYYASPTATTTPQRTSAAGSVGVNGSVDNLSSAISVEPIDTTELELGMNAVTVNGSSTDHGQESPSDSSIQESAPVNVNNSSSKTSSTPSSAPSKPMSWANVASQPAKPMPPKPVQPLPKVQARSTNSSSHESSGWENGQSKNAHQPKNVWSAPRGNRSSSNGTSVAGNSGGHRQQSSGQTSNSGSSSAQSSAQSDPTLNKLKQTNTYNPKSFDLTAKNARFFVIKSYSEDDIHRAIKYGVWCSTEHGNKRLDAAFKERDGKGPIYLLYSVNGSGHFCGMAQMMSGVDYQTHAGVWTQDKWKGSMEIKWIYVKDVPNNQLRHIRLENNENKPVTNSRDTQEVPVDKGKQVLKIMHGYRHSTSIFDDFGHYEKKEVEEGGEGSSKKKIVVNGTKN